MSARRQWRWGALAGAVGLVALAAATWWPQPAPATRWPAASPVDAAQRQPARAVTPAQAATLPAGPVASDAANGAPPGVTAAQWARLRAELAGRSDGPAELQRLADYFRFADAAQRFRRLRTEQPGSAQLVPLARELDAGLAARLQRREVSGGEARLLKLALLEVLQSDPVQRERELAAWQATVQPPAAATGAAAATAARDAEFLRRQSELVAAWQARPPAQRNPRELEQQIEALRRSSYPTTGR
ncbi:hypothetical protein [Ideonella sp. BN130291]|uniref:hypothetical protein n=1 Tax=Ideonella sp. BN130291 TaxID=3112940 RepID=UPI002E254CC4|nr:hypothetical protein [Ideonella sp. BN130291]